MTVEDTHKTRIDPDSSTSRYILSLLVSAHPHSVRTSQATEILGLARSTVTETWKALEAEGWVERTRDGRDMKAVATPDGVQWHELRWEGVGRVGRIADIVQELTTWIVRAAAENNQQAVQYLAHSISYISQNQRGE